MVEAIKAQFMSLCSMNGIQEAPVKDDVGDEMGYDVWPLLVDTKWHIIDNSTPRVHVLIK